jgi:hypothetical protein
MWQDPIVAEIRRVREAHARQFGFDLQTIYDALKEQDEQAVCIKASLSPKRIPPVQDADRDPTA